MRNVCVEKSVGVMIQANGRAMGRFSAPFSHKVFDALLANSLFPTKGPVPSHTRNTAQTIFDYEPKMVTLLNNEAGFPGTRHIEILNRYTDDFINSKWQVFNATKEGVASGVGPNGESAMEVSFGGAITDALFMNDADMSTPLYIGMNLVLRAMVRSVSGSTAIRFGDGGAVFSPNISIDENWKEITASLDVLNPGNISIRNNSSGNAGNIYIIYFQSEDATGRSDTITPSERISVDVLSYPYHGTGIDGTKCFDTTNGASVTSNVVTEGDGIRLHPFIGGKYRYYKPREDSTAYAVGDRRITAIGGYPAGGNGFYYECIKAGTSAAGEGTFEEDISIGRLESNGDFDNWTSDNPDDWTITEAGADIVTQSGSAARFLTTGAAIHARQNNKLTVGKSYYYEITVDDVTTSYVQLRQYSTASTYADLNSVGVHTGVFTALDAGFSLTRAGGACDSTISKVIIKEVTEDGTVAWENKGMYRMAKFLHEPESANELKAARDFSNVTYWPVSGTPVVTKDQIGIDGIANKAHTLTDDDGVVGEYISQAIGGLPNDSNSHIHHFYIRKDADTSRFPELQWTLAGGTLQSISTQINTQTGALNNVTTIGTVSSSSRQVRRGGFDWWHIILVADNNSTGNVSASITIFPARTTTWGITEGSATGSIIIDASQMEFTRKNPTSFIDTTTAPVTRNKSELSFNSSGIINDAAGTVMCDWIPHYNYTEVFLGQGMLGVGNLGRLIYIINTVVPSSYEGTNYLGGTLQSVNGVNYHLAMKWGGVTKEVFADGEGDGSAAYNGSWNDVGTFYIGAYSNLTPDSCNIGNVKIYRKALSTTEIAAEAA